MKVAVFSDVHGNLIALKRFVQATEEVVDSYLSLGDNVNYGPWNDECLELLQQLPGIRILEGNHERLFSGRANVRDESALVQDFFRSSRQFFSREDLISGLPLRTEIGVFECSHTIENRYIYENTPIEIACNYLIGHTHHQFSVRRSGFTIANPGSVGQNRRWINMAEYAILDTSTGDLQFHSVAYHFDRFLTELRLRGYPEHCIKYYANKPRKLS